MNLFSIWLKELKSFFQYDAKNWTFCFPIWLKELIFSKCSRNWTSLPYELLFYMTRIELFFDQYDSKSRIFHKKWLKVLNTFLNLTERVEPFLHWTQRIELFFCMCPNFFSKIFLKNNPIPKNDSKNWTPFLFVSTMTQRIELFVNDSLNWASFMNLFSIRVEFFFFWLNELNFFFLSTTQWIEPIFYVTQKIEIFGWKS